MGAALPDDEELALKRVGYEDIVARANEDLADYRLGLLYDRAHRHVHVDRNVSPAEDNLALSPYRALDLLLAGLPRCGLLGKEDHADAVVSRRRQLYALRDHIVAVKLIRNLNQDARAIAHKGICSDCSSVGKVLKY